MYVHNLDGLIGFRGTKQEICDKIEQVTAYNSIDLSSIKIIALPTQKDAGQSFIIEAVGEEIAIRILVHMFNAKAEKLKRETYCIIGVSVYE